MYIYVSMQGVDKLLIAIHILRTKEMESHSIP